MLRHLCVRPDAIAAYVDEHLFALGRGKLLHLWRHLPHFLDGCTDRGHWPAIPTAPLLHDIPNEHLQWFPHGRRRAPLGGTHPVLCLTDAHHLEHQEGHARIQVLALVGVKNEE